MAVDDKTGDLDESTPKGEVFKDPRYILLLSMYGGMIGLITGTFTYMPANEQWRAIATALACRPVPPPVSFP